MFGQRVANGKQFNYRAVDVQTALHPPPPTPPLPPSGYTCFNEQAGYMTPGIGRIHENIQNPFLDRKAIQIEIEKEIIRQEIIASDITRKRMVEDEVRRQMIFERELALQDKRCNIYNGNPFLPGGTKSQPNDLSFGRVVEASVEERIIMSLEAKFGNVTRHEIGGHKVFHFVKRRKLGQDMR